VDGVLGLQGEDNITVETISVIDNEEETKGPIVVDEELHMCR
jgi:hypothetical protein